MKKLMVILSAGTILAACASTPQYSCPVESFKAPKGGEVQIAMVNHGSIALSYKGYEIQVDPVGDFYSEFPKADLIVISHEHGDHLAPDVIKLLSDEETRVICNAASASKIDGAEIMANGDSAELPKGISVQAVPAYNITEGHTNFHPKGNGNGYLFNFGGLSVYVAGDTEEIPELSDLKDIDVAFLPVNQPYTMTIEQCISAAKTIAPKVLVPYHLSNTDAQAIKAGLEGSGIEVKLFDTLK